MKNETLFALGLFGLAAWALYRATAGHTSLTGGSVTTTRQVALHDWLFSLPPEVDWRVRPEFNKPDVFGDVVQASIMAVGSVVAPGVSTIAGAVVASQNRR